MNLRPTRGRGFTLIEILIVVIILGILASAVMPKFSDAREDATASTLQTTIASVKSRIDYEKVVNGAYPSALQASWFVGRQLPTHPDNTFGVSSVQVETTAGRQHPTSKVLKAGVLGAFWYNPTEGVFRARVADQGNSTSTLDFYNRVNGSSETSLGNYGGGGGS